MTMGLPAGFTEVSTIGAGSARYDTPAQTNSQTVAGIWKATDSYAKYLFLRGNTDFTTYVYVKIQSNAPLTNDGNCEIGCVVAGVRNVFETFPLPGGSTSSLSLFLANQSYQCEATDYTFNVTGPNGLNVSVTDSAHVSQMGDDYVYGGFGTDGQPRDTTVISSVGSYTIPAWAVQGTRFDIEALGGGSGPHFVSGGVAGGGAGSWAGLTLGYGAGLDMPLTTDSFSISPGAGGGLGAAGGDTTVTISGYGSVLTADGAAAGSGPSGVNSHGAAPDPSTLNNVKYTNAGYGVGASPAGFGTPATGGAVWVTAIDTSVPGSMYSWSFFDSGPVAGPAVDSLPGTQGILSSPSGTFMDLPTPGPSVTVNIGPSKLAIVNFGVNQMWGAAAGTDCIVAVKCTGANTIDADTAHPCLRYHTPNTSQVSGNGASRSDLWEFDNEGATTFELQYASTAGHTANFDTPAISVIPL